MGLREKNNFIMRNITKRLAVWALIVAAVLMIPLLASWPWTTGDFVFGAVVLFGFATMYELITRNMQDPKQRMITGAIVFAVLAFFWVGAATGYEGVFDRIAELTH